MLCKVKTSSQIVNGYDICSMIGCCDCPVKESNPECIDRLDDYIKSKGLLLEIEPIITD